MIRTRTGDSVTVRCPAKVNLFLELHGTRPDGYHEIETVMQAVTLYDDLALSARPAGIELRCSDPTLPSGPENIAWAAAELVRAEAGLPRGVAIVLEKRIPHGAGLGGGSSDAAGVLAGLNDLFGLGLSVEDLRSLAARLGSDAPFFVYGGTALCTGRGESVRPVPAPLDAWYVIACPEERLSTAAVYANLDRTGLTSGIEGGSLILSALARGDFDGVRAARFNRLDPVAESMCPEVSRAKRRLTEAASAPAIVSGSGSAVYTMVRTAEEAGRAVRALRGAGVARVFIARTEAASNPSASSCIPCRPA